MINVESLEQLEATIASREKVVVMFWAIWAGPCKMIMPDYEQYAGTLQHVAFLRVDVDALPDVSEKFGIRAMPTFKIYEDGEKISETVGADRAALSRAMRYL